jgi:hypothetical protein
MMGGGFGCRPLFWVEAYIDSADVLDILFA